MTTTENSNVSLKSFSLKNRKNWSGNRFAWFYAALILIAVSAFALLLKAFDIYESMAWRVVNVFFLFGGLILMLRDYNRHKDFKLTFIHAVVLSLRTGIYFTLLFLPVLAFVVGVFPSEQSIIDKRELFNSDFPIQSIVFVNWIETAATLAVASFIVPYFRGTGNSSTNK